MPYEGGAALSAIPGLIQRGQQIQATEQALQANRPLTAEEQAAVQNLQPTQVEVAPAVPAVPASLAEAYSGQQAVDQEGNPIEGPGPGTTTAKPEEPAKPAVHADGYTQKGLMEQMGPDNFAKLMGTKAGRQALQDKGVLTAEEMDHRVKVGKSRHEAKGMMEKADVLAEGGDAAGSIMMRARAWERIADSSDDPNKVAWAHQMANNLQKQALDARDDERSNQDSQVFFKAMHAYRADPGQESLDELLRAAGEMRSKAGRGYRDRLINNMTTESLKGLDDLQVQTLYAETSKKVAASLKESHSLTFGQAMNQVMQERPELIGPLVHSYLSGKRGKIPDEVMEQLFGEKVTLFKGDRGTDQMRAAELQTMHEDNLRLNDPDPNKRKLAWQKYNVHLAEIVARTRKGTNPDDITARHDDIRIENAMNRAKADARHIQDQLDKDTMYQMYSQDPKRELPKNYKDKLAEIERLNTYARSAEKELARRVPGFPTREEPAAVAPAITDQHRQQASSIVDQVKKEGIKDPERRKARIMDLLQKAGIDPNVFANAKAPQFQNQGR